MVKKKLYVIKNCSFNITFVDNFILQHRHLYSIKSSLKFLYQRKQSQYLYSILQVTHFLALCPYLHLIL